MIEKYLLDSYRWVVPGVFMVINRSIQMLRITYELNTGLAANFYGVTEL